MLPLIQIMRLPRKFCLCNFISNKRIHICYLFINFGLNKQHGKHHCFSIYQELLSSTFLPTKQVVQFNAPLKLENDNKETKPPSPKPKQKEEKQSKVFVELIVVKISSF